MAVYQYVRHIFGAKYSPTCANCALRRNASDNETTFPEAAQSMKNNFYIEDYLESSPIAEKATQKAKDFLKF